MRHPPKMAVAAVLVGLLASCGDGGGSGTSGACGPIRREALDPDFLLHVGADAEVDYTSEPPTSGPHLAGPPVEGVVAEPIPGPIQVGILERGDVLLQHRPDLPVEDLERLHGLAGERVVVAPGVGLPEAVVATAWVHKRTCSAVDLEPLEDFVAERVGKGPDDS